MTITATAGQLSARVVAAPLQAVVSLATDGEHAIAIAAAATLEDTGTQPQLAIEAP
jgi:hypothetical protein